jgi:transposase-like protein
MSERKRRRFSREFKLRVIERLEAGESGTTLGLELSIKRTIIYRWRDQCRQGGTAALRRKPGPRTREEALELDPA